VGTNYSNSFNAISKQGSQNAVFAKMCLEHKHFSKKKKTSFFEKGILPRSHSK